ncbi:hypothetical protein CLF_101205 [Clonorchis sinensis]|uniref:Uncharacterized protein n=1 Tax=Clonorchis sinensis TaxID=79923 RepID=G7Y5A0_CLOSI|nr:hypothetical protein CLF_101205 [Clonorchis sinensis]
MHHMNRRILDETNHYKVMELSVGSIRTLHQSSEEPCNAKTFDRVYVDGRGPKRPNSTRINNRIFHRVLKNNPYTQVHAPSLMISKLIVVYSENTRKPSNRQNPCPYSSPKIFDFINLEARTAVDKTPFGFINNTALHWPEISMLHLMDSSALFAYSESNYAMTRGPMSNKNDVRLNSTSSVSANN